MKKVILFITAVLTFHIQLFTFNSFAQAPQKMSYQAVIRNSSDVLISSSTIGMRFSILQGSAAGSAIYVETQTTSTNNNGLVSLEIGSGTIITGTFSAINWAAGPYFIKTETDPSGGTAYTISGTSQLLSVPYALFSANGPSGIQGATGSIGATGTVGIIGATGDNGSSGTAGTTGTIGATGNNGSLGATGTTGTIGATGNNGTPGLQGIHGTTGTTGTIGVTGTNGTPGLQGIHGTTGTTGTIGATGNNGSSGSTGATGTIGATGTFSGTAWGTTGNGGTVDGTNFIGTIDDVAFNIKVNNQMAGRIDPSGLANTFYGFMSGASNIGYYNTASGMNALYANTTGNNNTAHGKSALTSNTIGSSNTACGVYALDYNTAGNYNTACGVDALFNATGSSNTGFGEEAGYNITTGSNNTAIGYNARVPFATSDNQVRIGDVNVSYAGVQVAWSITSDKRLKSNIQNSNLGLDFISKLRPVSYIRINDASKKLEYGFIAQEVEEALNKSGAGSNGIITKDDSSMYSVRYNDLLAPMVKAMQEQQVMIEVQKQQIEAQKKQLEEQKLRLEKIEAAIFH